MIPRHWRPEVGNVSANEHFDWTNLSKKPTTVYPPFFAGVVSSSLCAAFSAVGHGPADRPADSRAPAGLSGTDDPPDEFARFWAPLPSVSAAFGFFAAGFNLQLWPSSRPFPNCPPPPQPLRQPKHEASSPICRASFQFFSRFDLEDGLNSCRGVGATTHGRKPRSRILRPGKF